MKELILAIDIGNTDIVVGGFDQDNIVFIERLSTDISKTELEYGVLFRALIDLYDISADSFTGAIISSVVPPLNSVVRSAIKKLLKIDSLLVGPGVKNGISIHMDNPASVGADLIVNAVAGQKLYGMPLIIVELGTATTMCVIDEAKTFIGGIIMPGVGVSLGSLVDSTSQLPKISLEAAGRIIGKNTVDCMKSGVIVGHAAAIDGMIDRIWDELGYETSVVATGTLANTIVPHCKKEIVIDSELTLKGLKIIYEKNRKY